MFLSSPADAQRRKAASSGAASEAKPKKRRAAPAAPPPPIAEAAAEAPAAIPAPVADEPAPAPPPVSSKRAARQPVAAAPAEDTTTDLGPPPQRSLRKKSMKNAVSTDVSEDEEAQPTRRKKPTRHLRRDQDEEAEEDRAAATKTDDASSEKAEEDPAPPEKEAEAEPEAEPESDADTDTDSPAAKRKRPKPFLFDIMAALRGFQRHFAYADDRYNELPNYDLGGAPAIALEVAVYPFKNSKGSLSAGFTGSFEYAVGLGTTYKVPTGDQEGTHGTTALGYALGVRGNYAFGSTLSNIVSAGAEFGAQSFIIDHPPPVRGNANIPSVEYKFIRPNVQGRFPVMDKLAIVGSAGYLMVSSAGEIVSASYFRGDTSSASGLDLGLGVAYELKMSPKGALKFLELRPMLTFRRYTFKFNPDEATDPYIATGATDDYVGLNLGVATRL